MTDKELKEWKQFFDTEQAVITAFLNLIQDLVPVIGLDEAQRLLNIIKEVQTHNTDASDGDLISRSDIKDHIGELLLVYSGEELANAILNAIDNAEAIDVETQLLGAELHGIKIGYEEAQKKLTRHKPHEDKEPNFTSVSTGYAAYTAEDIRTCDYCKYNAGLPSNNGTMEYSGACKNCVAKDMWEAKKNDK